MKKIMFNDRYGLTQAVINRVKTQTRRIEKDPQKPRFSVGEVVAVAESYSYLGMVSRKDVPGWKNKMFVRAEDMKHQIRITGIRKERLQDISEEDCLAEGIEFMDEADASTFSFYDYKRQDWLDSLSPRDAYATLIELISGRGTWESNPFVVVYEFELIR